MGTLPPPNQESPQDWGLLDIMQHVAAMLKHRAFRDVLLTKASKQMLQKFLDFEDRALTIFHQDALLLLGDLPPAMQPFLYCLAHPGTAAWASRYGFMAMQSLDTCPMSECWRRSRFLRTRIWKPCCLVSLRRRC